jgi:hydrogenase maturation protein HypF
MPRLRLQIQGTVQGVGFRPFVFQLATGLGLDGWVQNRPEGVLVEIQGLGAALAAFLGRLRTDLPRAARIRRLRAGDLPEQGDEGPFRILPSAGEGERLPSIPADLALCPECAAELRDPAARRHRYPFTNCTNCGPRYSIVTALPYDRPATAMAGFPLCPDCAREYAEPRDRRFHAQPVACPECGPRLAFHGPDGAPGPSGEAALAAAVDLLRRGEILALKGLGGFQLLVDARSEPAVRRLRTRKGRPAKPFAVMFQDRAALTAACMAGPAALAVLDGPQAPILLLPRRPDGPVATAVAPGNPDLGAFLPNTPLHLLLLEAFAGPLVCTSGNRSEEPMAIGLGEALERLEGIADGYLDHDRPVLRPLDDSVARIEGGRLHLLRRARGYAPLPLAVAGPAGPVLALGGHQKATVTLLARGEAVVSQHLGDLDGPRGRALLERTAADLLDLFQAEPALLACDLHPDYGSTRVGEALAARLGRPLVRVQHHHAHVAAVLAEHGQDGPVLGLAWDGSGYGPDRTVWGGEALVVDGARCQRAGHLAPFPLPGGERAVREPRRSALGLCLATLGQAGPAADAFPARDLEILERAARNGLNAPVCTSIGRLFDAVACLAGIQSGPGFEGQAAMALEFQARAGQGAGAYPLPLAAGVADPAPLVRALCQDLRRGVARSAMAYRFHAALAGLAVAFAEAAGLERVVLSGGCFQNKLLAELCQRRLAARGFRVLRPERYPANDGGLSLGQAWVAARMHAEV